MVLTPLCSDLGVSTLPSPSKSFLAFATVAFLAFFTTEAVFLTGVGASFLGAGFASFGFLRDLYLRNRKKRLLLISLRRRVILASLMTDMLMKNLKLLLSTSMQKELMRKV